MSDWSSFKGAKKQSDAWRGFLNESVEPTPKEEIPLDEFFFGAKKRTGGKHGLSYDKNQYTKDLVCKAGDKDCGDDSETFEEETYNADDVAALYKALDDINKALGGIVDRQALSNELQALLTDPQGNNYKIEEQSVHKAAVILGRMPQLGPDGAPDPQKYPNLTKLFMGAITNDKTRQHLHMLLARAGFFGAEGDQVPAWIQKTQPAQQSQQTQDADGDGAPDEPAGEEEAAEGEKIVVMWPRVQARTQELMGDRWDAKKVRLVLQALSRLNKNPNIEFTWNAQIGEDMDVTAAYRLLAKSKAAEGIDQQFMKDVVQAIMDVSGVQIRDFNIQGNVMTKLGPSKSAQEPEAAAPDATPDEPEETPDEEEEAAPEKAPDADGDGTPDAEDTDDDGDGQPDAEDADADGDGVPDADEPEEEVEEEGAEYEVPTLAAFPRIKAAWEASDPPPSATFAQDMAAFINFIGPYASAAKESGVLKDPTVNESVIQQLVGRPGGEDGEAWRDSPFMRIGNKGAIGKEMAAKLNRLSKNKQGTGRRDRIERVLNVVLGKGGSAPETKMARAELLNLLGMIKPAEQKEAPKDQPKQKAAAAPDAGSARFSRDKVRGQRARAADTAAKIGRAGSGGFMEEGADTLNESKTIDRWKTLAGIK